VRARLVAEIEAQRALLRTKAGQRLAAGLGALALLTFAGLAILWPGDRPAAPQAAIVISRGIVSADVTAVIGEVCPVENLPGCKRVNIRLTGGPRSGTSSYLYLPGDDATPRLSPGDHIRVAPNDISYSGGQTAAPLPSDDPSQAPYGYVDFERRAPLLWLALGFVAVVIVLGRRVGALSLLGLAIGLLVISAFVVPAILDGSSPFAVGLVGSFAAMFATIVLVYGIGAKSLASLLGTAVSLLVTAVLAVVFVKLAHITGTSGDEATLLRGLTSDRLSLQGLVLAGILIGALGILNDVTVSQASTVLALRRASPNARLAELYREGLAVGRDHLGATVNTLAFAYAGASLPLLLIFSSQAVGFGDAINNELVATEIVAALVGSIGIVLAVPLTTVTAALLAARLPVEVLPAADHAAHAH
jgi:uncharacterized membrane protein